MCIRDRVCSIFGREDVFSPAAAIAALRERTDVRVVDLGPRGEVNHGDYGYLGRIGFSPLFGLYVWRSDSPPPRRT
eukprot:12136202-Alexandrium_andersonii.AAC.1